MSDKTYPRIRRASSLQPREMGADRPPDRLDRVGFAGPDARYIIAAMYYQQPGGDSLDHGVHVLTDLVATIFGAAVPAPAVIPPPPASNLRADVPAKPALVVGLAQARSKRNTGGPVRNKPPSASQAIPDAPRVAAHPASAMSTRTITVRITPPTLRVGRISPMRCSGQC